MHRSEQGLVEDRGLRSLRHRRIGRSAANAGIGARHYAFCLLQSDCCGFESTAKGIGYIEHSASIGIADGRVASAVLLEYEHGVVADIA